MNTDGYIRELSAGEMPAIDEVALTQRQADRLNLIPRELRQEAYRGMIEPKRGTDYKRLKRTGRIG